jgi:hypothetical protein
MRANDKQQWYALVRQRSALDELWVGFYVFSYYCVVSAKII